MKRVVIDAERLLPGDVLVLALTRVTVFKVMVQGFRVTVITSQGLPVDFRSYDLVTVER